MKAQRAPLGINLHYLKLRRHCLLGVTVHDTNRRSCFEAIRGELSWSRATDYRTIDHTRCKDVRGLVSWGCSRVYYWMTGCTYILERVLLNWDVTKVYFDLPNIRWIRRAVVWLDASLKLEIVQFGLPLTPGTYTNPSTRPVRSLALWRAYYL